MKQGSGDDPFTDEDDVVDERVEKEDKEAEGSEREADSSDEGRVRADGSASETPVETAREQATPSESSESATEDIDLSKPAFEYDSNMQEPIYVRDSVYEEYERTERFEIELKLDEHGVSNPKGREIGTALVETAHNHWPEIVQRVLGYRGLDVDLEDI